METSFYLRNYQILPVPRQSRGFSIYNNQIRKGSIKMDVDSLNDPLGSSMHLLFALAKHWEISADHMLRNTGNTNDPRKRAVSDSLVSQLRECSKQLRQRAKWIKEMFEIDDLIRLIGQRIEREQSSSREQFTAWLESMSDYSMDHLLKILRNVAVMKSLPDFSLSEGRAADFLS